MVALTAALTAGPMAGLTAGPMVALTVAPMAGLTVAPMAEPMAARTVARTGQPDREHRGAPGGSD
ncbi:MAG TPA: hypothetical protein VMU51_32790 [Mycobacteriales bacterium]|nr:hypothetical protein [Mycobacteriales bacterium]